MILSILIVSWNTKALLADCLASIYEHPPTTAAFEVLVVDNASTDGSVEMVRQQFPNARLIENRGNVGFARANNQAIQASTGSLVLLLNPDTKVGAGALDALLRFMEEHPDAGACGARLLNGDGTLQHSCFPAPTLARELLRLFHLDGRLRYRMEQWDQTRPRAVDVVLGACLLVRWEALNLIGLLDEGYFMYSEEVDLCRRLQAAGWALYWVPQAEVIHYGGQSTQQVPLEMFLHLYRAKLTYFRKHEGTLAATAYKGILLAASLARLLLSPLAWMERGPQRRHHFTLAARYWKLVVALPGL